MIDFGLNGLKKALKERPSSLNENPMAPMPDNK